MQTFPINGEILRGAIELESTGAGILPHRLPAWARAQCPDPQLMMAEEQPSGVRLVFRSAATAIELDVLRTKRVYVGAPPRPDGVYDLLIDGELTAQASASGGKMQSIDMVAGTMKMEAGPVGTLRFDGLPARDKRIELWLPFNETTEIVALRADAQVVPDAAANRKTWLHYGSSISHGSNAASPTTIWPAVAASRGGMELVNMGFSGSALLDPFVARTIRDTAADFISLKIGINLVNTDLMRLRALGAAMHGFLDTIRDGHAHTPLLLVSPILCPIHEDTPGPTLMETSALSEGRLLFRAAGRPAESAAGKLTLNVIRKELEKIVRQRATHDAKLFYLDGRELYGAADVDALPLPDELHPDAATHRLMGERFAQRVFNGLLSPAPGTRP